VQLRLAPWALLAVAAMWGISFVWMKDILDQQDVYSFLTSRFLVAAAAMILLKPKVLKAFSKELVFKGLIVGMALGSGYIFQTLGLERTTPAITGFITGLYVVFTPLLASIFLKERLTLAMWGYVLLAVIGLGILSVKGWSVGLGEIFVLISAVLFAIHRHAADWLCTPICNSSFYQWLCCTTRYASVGCHYFYRYLCDCNCVRHSNVVSSANFHH